MADGTATAHNFTKKEIAAVLLAADDLSDEQIAQEVGVSRRTLANWKNLPEFQEQVVENVAEIQRRMMRHAIAKRHKRLAVLDDLHVKLLQVVDERAAEYATLAESGSDETIPAGGTTGLMVRQLKQIGAGREAQVVEEFVVDVATVKAIQGLHEQAAKELGQWTEKLNVSGGLKREYVIVGADEMDGDA